MFKPVLPEMNSSLKEEATIRTAVLLVSPFVPGGTDALPDSGQKFFHDLLWSVSI
eukprot:SAG11_NODE_97_length_16960_cov_22.407405_4_plen_55_part_00